jgi:hypothetical protein
MHDRDVVAGLSCFATSDDEPETSKEADCEELSTRTPVPVPVPVPVAGSAERGS